MPAKVTGVQISNPLNATSLVVTWNPNKDAVTGYNVYRGLAKEGDFTKLTAQPIVGTSYTDITAQQRSHTIYWYRITAVESLVEGDPSEPNCNVLIARDDNRQTLSRLGDSPEQNHLKILNRIVYLDGLLLRRGGEFIDLYVRKTAGPKCPDCFSPARNEPTDPDCQTCFGTTYTGGFDKYANVLCKIKPITTKLTLMEMGLKIDSTPPAWIGTFPIVNDGDILVRKFNNKRYELQSVEQIISRGILVRQQFTITELLPTQVPNIFALE